jgi:hypothetical protein
MILCGTNRRGAESVFKLNKKFWGIFIFIYIFSVAACYTDFNIAAEHAEKDHFPDIHCWIDLNSFGPIKAESFAFVDLTSYWRLNSRLTEPHFPILADAIFKVPKIT